MRKKSKRPALAFAPVLGALVPGRDAYVSLGVLRRAKLAANRYWTFHGLPTTVEVEGGKTPTYAKLWDRFPNHQDAESFAELLLEYAAHEIPRPSGYADVFHSRFKSPRVCYSINATLAPAFAGGWQAAIKPGVHRGQFMRYDMRSAYLWACSAGLPDTRTYRRVTAIARGMPGVYRVTLERPVDDAPFPFNRAALSVLASADEIDTYQLPVTRVLSGVTWTREIDPAEMWAAIMAVSTWKQAGRSYWGRWGQTERIECHAGGTTWKLPNIAANLPWAHLIVSRVKLKLWHAVDASAVHVFTDSVITRKPLAIGPEIGAWKLEQIYPDGIVIKGPGQYGDINGTRFEKMAGVPHGSALRDMLADRYSELLAG